MTIEHYDTTQGVEAIRVLCDVCRSRLGATILFRLTLVPLTPYDEAEAEKVATDHEKQFPNHSIRVLRFRK